MFSTFSHFCLKEDVGVPKASPKAKYMHEIICLVCHMSGDHMLCHMSGDEHNYVCFECRSESSRFGNTSTKVDHMFLSGFLCRF